MLLLVSISACSKPGGKDGNVDYWTCTMHPSVHAKEPGKCPICSMDLVPIRKSNAGASARARAMCGSRSALVRRRSS